MKMKMFFTLVEGTENSSTNTDVKLNINMRNLREFSLKIESKREPDEKNLS